MSDNSDSWKTWTSSYGERCIENEQSLHDVLLESNTIKSENNKKYVIFGICTLSIIIVGIICFVFVI